MAKASERAIALAKEVLAKIAAYDPYFPKPNEAMLIAWSEHISLKNAQRDDMLDAVTKFYESNIDGAKPMPATISMLARQIRQDRSMRQDYTPPVDKSDDPELPAGVSFTDTFDRKMSMAEWEAKHGEKFPRIRIGQPMPDVDEEGNPKLVACPFCHAGVGADCTVAGSADSLKRHRAHPARWDALRATEAQP